MAVQIKTLQSREEWLEERKNFIGGSDAGAILGLNHFMSNTDLWDIKTGNKQQEDISDKPYVKYGTVAEHLLRELFKLDYPQYTVGYKENNMFVNDKYPFAHASLDGWLKDQDGKLGVWECKTANIMSKAQAEAWKDDKIPDMYYAQLMHQLMVTDFDFAVIKAQLKYDMDDQVYLRTIHRRYERSECVEDIQYLAEKEKEFWHMVQTGQRPAAILPSI